MKDLTEEQKKKLSKYTVGDMQNPKKRREILKIKPDYFEYINKTIKSIQKHDAEKAVQPFITNNNLRDLINTITPSWVSYLGLFISIITLILLVYQIFLK